MTELAKKIAENAKEFIAIQDIIKAAKENPEEYYLKYSTLYKEIK